MRIFKVLLNKFAKHIPKQTINHHKVTQKSAIKKSVPQQKPKSSASSNTFLYHFPFQQQWRNYSNKGKQKDSHQNTHKTTKAKSSWNYNRIKSDTVISKAFFTLLGGVGALIYLYIQAYEERRKYHFHAIEHWLSQKEAGWERTEKLFKEAEAMITNPLLRLYATPDEDKINNNENIIIEIDHHIRYIEHLRKNISLYKATLEANYLEKTFMRAPLLFLEFLDQELNLQWHQLTIARLSREILLKREQKSFNEALDRVNAALNFVDNYKALTSVNVEERSEQLLTRLQVNLYNHKAKINRALAGRSLTALEVNQLELSKTSYEKALSLEPKNPTIISSLGFLLVDWAETEIDSTKRKKLLEDALAYQQNALALEMRSSDIHHGIGYTLYLEQKLNYDLQEAIEHQVLKRALFELSQVKPNARLDRDKALIWELLGNDKKALTLLDEGYKKDPKNCLVLLDRGRIYIKMQKYTEAKADLEKGQHLYGYDNQLKQLFEGQLNALKQAQERTNNGTLSQAFSALSYILRRY